MFREFWLARRWRTWAYGLGTVVLALQITTVYLGVLLNAFISHLYDVLQSAIQEKAHADIDRFYGVMWEFFWLSVPWALVWPALSFCLRHFALAWREALTESYTLRWRVASGGATLAVDSVSQRIQEDTHAFAKGLDSIVKDIVMAVMDMFAMVPVLVRLAGWRTVLVCVGGNLFGLAMSAVVGRQLVSLDYNNQREEAAYRKELVYAEDGVDGRGSAETLRALFLRVRSNYRMLYRHLTYFEVWIRAFDRLMDAAPKLVTVPWLYSGDLTLGTYMQIKTAFEQVQGRMSTIAHRWTEINYLRSVARRLRELEAELERALPADDVEGGGGDGEMVRLVHPSKTTPPDSGSPSVVAALRARAHVT